MNTSQASRPAVIKTLVCLANSRKPPQGRCIAGRELVGTTVGGWVRPVSARATQEVSSRECQYQDGSEPRLLDIINVPLLNPSPESHQQENWLLDPAWFWVKSGTFPYGSLGQIAQGSGSLWVNGYHTSNGLNDSVPSGLLATISDSLRLIVVHDLQIRVYMPYDRRRVQAIFSFEGAHYRLWVTDPVVESQYYAQADGYYNLGSRYLTVSLSAAFHGDCYKLVAAVIGGN